MSESKPKTAQGVYEIVCELNAAEQDKLMTMLEQDRNNGAADDEVRQSWIEESNRRIKLIEEGKMELVPADEVHAKLQTRLDSMKP